MIPCPHCGTPQDATSPADPAHPRPPKPGDMNICMHCGLVGEFRIADAGALEIAVDLSPASYRVAKRRLEHVQLAYRSEDSASRASWPFKCRRLFVDFDATGDTWGKLIRKTLGIPEAIQ